MSASPRHNVCKIQYSQCSLKQALRKRSRLINARKTAFSTGKAILFQPDQIHGRPMATTSDPTYDSNASAYAASSTIPAGANTENNMQIGEVTPRRRCESVESATARCLEPENRALAEDAASLIVVEADSGEQQKRVWGLPDHLCLYTSGAGSSFSATAERKAGKSPTTGAAAFAGRKEEEERDICPVVAIEPRERGNTYATDKYTSATVAPGKWKVLQATEKPRVVDVDCKAAARFVAAAPAKAFVRAAKSTTAVTATNAARNSPRTKTRIAAAPGARIRDAAPPHTAAESSKSEYTATAATAAKGRRNRRLHDPIIDGIGQTSRSHFQATTPHVRCACMSMCTQSSNSHTAETEKEGCTSNTGVPARFLSCWCCAGEVDYEGLASLECVAHPSPSKDACRPQHALLREPLQQAYSKCDEVFSGQKSIYRLKKPIFGMLLLDVSRRCWLSAAALEPRKFVVYAAVLVLAFTCGSLYGNHTACLVSCPSSCSLEPAGTRSGRHSSEFDLEPESASLAGAAAAAAASERATTPLKGDQFLPGYAEAEPAETVERAVAAETPAAATFSLDGAACHGKEEGETATPSAGGAVLVRAGAATRIDETGGRKEAVVAAVAVNTRWDSPDIAGSTRAQKTVANDCQKKGKTRDIPKPRGKHDNSGDMTDRRGTGGEPHSLSDMTKQLNSTSGHLHLAGMSSRSNKNGEPPDGSSDGYSFRSSGEGTFTRGSGTRTNHSLKTLGLADNRSSSTASGRSRHVVKVFPDGKSRKRTVSNLSRSNVASRHSWKITSSSTDKAAATDSDCANKVAAGGWAAGSQDRGTTQRQLGTLHSFLGSDSYQSRAAAAGKNKAQQQRTREVLEQRRAGAEAATYHRGGTASERKDFGARREKKERQAAEKGRSDVEQLALRTQMPEGVQGEHSRVEDNVLLLNEIQRLLFDSLELGLLRPYNPGREKQQAELQQQQDIARPLLQNPAEEQQRQLQKERQPTPHLNIQPAGLPRAGVGNVDDVNSRRGEELVKRHFNGVASTLTSIAPAHVGAGAALTLASTSRSAATISSASILDATAAPVPPPAARAAVQARRLQGVAATPWFRTPASRSEKLPHIREEPRKRGWSPKKRFEAKVPRGIVATPAGRAPTEKTAAAAEKKKESPSNKRAVSDKKRRNSPRRERGLAAHTPVLYIAEWPAYAHTGDGGKRFIDQLRHYSENFRPPPRVTENGKKLFDVELACGTNEVFKEGLVALRDRIHNFDDLTRILKHLAKTERDFADLLDYTQYSKLPTRAAVTGFAILLRTAFEGMVFSFCKSVFLRKGFKGNFNRKELYSNVVWLYHRTQTQYWMLLLVRKMLKQTASSRPHTGIMILRSEETHRFGAVGGLSLGCDGGSKDQMLEASQELDGFTALQRSVSSAIRRKVGLALSRFEEHATEKGDASSFKGVVLPHLFVMGYYCRTSRGTEVREGLFGSEVEADALEEMMENLPTGHVLLQLSLVDEWLFKDPVGWAQLRKNQGDILTAYTLMQMLRAELSWDPSLASLGAYSVAYAGVTDLFTRQITSAEERRYDPDVHVLLSDDSTRFIETAGEQGCHSRILDILSENPLQLRRSAPANRVSIRGTGKLLPSGDILTKAKFGIGVSIDIRRVAEKNVKITDVMIHVIVRGFHGRSPETNELDFTASELVSRLLQRSKGYYNVLAVKTGTLLTSQSMTSRGKVTKCGSSVATWIFIVAACSMSVFFLVVITLLIYHQKAKLPWWLQCLCSTSPPWSVEEEAPAGDSLVGIPGEYSNELPEGRLPSAKQLQVQQSARADLKEATSTAEDEAVKFATEEREKAQDSEGGHDVDAESDEATLEPSRAALKGGAREGEEARGWLPPAAKWVEDRTVPAPQLPASPFVGGAAPKSAKGEQQTQQQQNAPRSGTEENHEDEENDGILYANARSPSRLLEALGSASTCASTCGYTGLRSSKSMTSAEWQLPSSLTSSSALLLQHQQPKQISFSCGHSERDISALGSFEGKISRGSADSSRSFCARVPYSPFPYLTSRTYSYSELSAAAALSQQHAAAPLATVRVPDHREILAAASTAPADGFFQQDEAYERDMPYKQSPLSGNQFLQGTNDNTSSLPCSCTRKDTSVGTCAAELSPQKPESCCLPESWRLGQGEGVDTSNNGSNGIAAELLVRGDGAVPTTVARDSGVQTGAAPFGIAKKGSHGSIPEETLDELEEFD